MLTLKQADVQPEYKPRVEIRSTLILAKHQLDRSLDCAHIRVWFWTVA